MKFVKKNIHYIIFIPICLLLSVISTHAVSYAYASIDVKFDNTGTGITATNVKGAIDELYRASSMYSSFSQRLANVKNYKSVLYPVGSIYISTQDSTAAAVRARFGGTWVAYAEGRELAGVSANSTSEAWRVSDTTDGSDTVVLTANNIPSHNHTYEKFTSPTGSTTLTVANMLSHTHSFPMISIGASGSGASKIQLQKDRNLVRYDSASGSSTWSTSTSDSNAKGEKNYRTVVLGYGTTTTSERGNGSGHTHTISAASSGVATGSRGSGTALSVRDPYVVVYMWKRTA